jgi:hypothetical protein
MVLFCATASLLERILVAQTRADCQTGARVIVGAQAFAVAEYRHVRRIR